MGQDVHWIIAHFKGNFIDTPELLQGKLSRIKAYVFDWDGVFNDGVKDAAGTSPFNEIDSMGTNMLRFNHYLRHGKVPEVAIISGEHNKAAKTLARREHFNVVYSGIKFKTEAIQHFCRVYSVKPEEVAFVFDDVLDLSVAAVCGVRIMVSRKANPLMIDFAVQRNMVDYLTACTGNEYAVREASELIMGLCGQFKETLEHRMNYTETYQKYLKERNTPEAAFYISKQSIITQEENI